MALDGKGKLKTDKVGARSTGKGAAIGGAPESHELSDEALQTAAA